MSGKVLSEKDREYYTRHIQERLSQFRFEHSVNVSREAVRLAEIHGADVEKAELAGLLHDVMKDAGKKEQLALLEQYGVRLSEIEQNAPKLWHAIAGAVYAKKVLRIRDKDVLNAIRYHTTGRAGMSLLEKIIYLADSTSAEREYNGVDKMRKLVVSDLDEALRFAYADSLQKRLDDGMPMHPDTVEGYNEVMLEKMQSKS